MNNNLLKNRFTLLAIVCLLMMAFGCGVFRPGTTAGSGNTDPDHPSPGPASSDTRFLNTISTDHTDVSDNPEPPPKTRARNSRNDRNRTAPSPVYRSTEKTTARTTQPLSVLQLKYSMLTSTPVEQLDNQKLLEFMDEWYGVPYRFGGTTKRGIDCSAFAHTLMANVYGVSAMPRMSKDQYAASAKISRRKLREGDLVFFHTYGKGKAVTHVGVYLYNHRFVHASVSGVQIDDLDGDYYSHHYVGAGRILE